MTDVQWSRDWLLENTALPLIEAMEGHMVSFGLSIQGNFYLTGTGTVENKTSASSLNVYDDEPKLVVDAFVNRLKGLGLDEVYRTASVPHKRFQYRECNGTGMIVPAERPL